MVLVIDLALSVDNAGVNAAIVRSFPKDMRNKVLWVGVIVAIILRIILSVFIGYLYKIPFLKLVGGIWVVMMAIKMFADGDEEDSKIVGAKALLYAGILLGWTDLTMSMDNVLALIGAANGNFILVSIGVILTIPLLFLATKGIVSIVERYPQINFVFACLLGYVGFKMVFSDIPNLERLLNWIGKYPTYLTGVAGFFVVLLVGIWINYRESKAKTESIAKSELQATAEVAVASEETRNY